MGVFDNFSFLTRVSTVSVRFTTRRYLVKARILPVFPNWFPYNDMLLDGHLKVGDYAGVKTRSWKWDYRGPVFLYTSGRTAPQPARTYRYHNSPHVHKIIIGVAELVEVRDLTNAEALKMVCNFNRLTPLGVRDLIHPQAKWKWDNVTLDLWRESLYGFYGCGGIAPLPIGFFFQNQAKFRSPVPFNWPAGPVKPIMTKIVKGSPLQQELEWVGY